MRSLFKRSPRPALLVLGALATLIAHAASGEEDPPSPVEVVPAVDLEREDRQAALHFTSAAREAGVRRIVYLGGLGREPGLSRHLRSRQEVERILRESGVPTLELVTPVCARVGRELIDSIRNTTTVEDDSARRLFPDVRPRGIREAIGRALLNEDREFAVTRCRLYPLHQLVFAGMLKGIVATIEDSPTSRGDGR